MATQQLDVVLMAAGTAGTAFPEHVDGIFQRALSVAPPGSGAAMRAMDPPPPASPGKLVAGVTLSWENGSRAQVADLVVAELQAQAQLSADATGLARENINIQTLAKPAADAPPAATPGAVSLGDRLAAGVAAHPVKLGFALGALGALLGSYLRSRASR